METNTVFDSLPETVYVIAPAPASGPEREAPEMEMEMETLPICATSPEGETGLLIWTTPQAAETFCRMNAPGHIVGVVPTADVLTAKENGTFQHFIIDLPPEAIAPNDDVTRH